MKAYGGSIAIAIRQGLPLCQVYLTVICRIDLVSWCCFLLLQVWRAKSLDGLEVKNKAERTVNK